ncbi:patellin-2-like [Dorcoceras hygrometricum]|uniref:Patellin-2-like n=1 Tax=Dorcoceras hygrometricum TaxID=472368 RepID=A0A2Z7CV10_9LAMI|nr:patellin-2-like [Dorcoceras hygrometricum]
MAEETKKSIPESPCAAEEASLSDVPVIEKPTTTVVDKQVAQQPEPEKVGNRPAEEVVEGEKEKDEAPTESDPFKEESNKVDDLIDPQKKALYELKLLIQEALNKHEFTAPPRPAEEKREEEPKTGDKKEESKSEEKKEEQKTEACEVTTEVPSPPPPANEPVITVPEAAVENKNEDETIPLLTVEEKKESQSETVIENGKEAAGTVVEEVKETIIHEVRSPAPPPCNEPTIAPAEKEKEKEASLSEEESVTVLQPEEVSIWGIPLLADARSDVILLKFLRARDFKVKDAFSMLKSVVAWRKEFKIDELMEDEGIMEGLEKVVYVHGVDKEGHPVCYNAFGEFQDNDLYTNTFADSEKRAKFLKWYIQFLEQNIRKLDFCPDGPCTIVQITDLQNSPGFNLFKREMRQATNQALRLLQDNYPEYVAKQVFINVPWWYVAYNKVISPFLSQRTKSKFVFAGPTKTTETLFKYLAPEQVPVQYGGLSKDVEQDFTFADAAIEETIMPTSKHTVELPITEACVLVWELRVVGWDVAYGAEFVPTSEDGYTWIIQKSRKIGPTDEQVISYTFKAGEAGKVVLTFDNQTSKKKQLLYRSKIKPSD